MKLRTKISFVLMAFATGVCGAQTTPQHLEPMPPFSVGHYDQIVFENLVKQNFPMLCMVVKPSFSPEYAVCMYRKTTNNKPVSKNDPIFLEVREATTMIWGFKAAGQNTMKVSPKENVKCRSFSKSLPTDLGLIIDKAWEKTLNNTRYCEPYRGCDGVTYVFRAGYLKFGESWCPSEGEPKAIADLGEELIKYAKSDVAHSAALLISIEKLANLLQSFPAS